MDLEPYHRIASGAYLGELTRRPIGEIRAMRTECQRVEDTLSYLRRLVQGRLDIVRAEHDRRLAGGAPSALAELVAQLPETLAQHVGGSSTRPPHDLLPPDDPDVTADLDAICNVDTLASLPKYSSDELRHLLDGLVDLEQVVSGRRRVLFDRLDALSAELTRRYRSGEATVDALLQ
jgi:hypothetical protein